MSPESSTATARTETPGTGVPETTPRHVLIVEDDEELADLLQVWATDCYGRNARIHVAHSVAEGKATLESQSALDIVLLDRRLPDGSGRDLLEVLSCQFDAITVMITAVSPDSDILGLPIDDYLVKPIDRETLVKTLSLLEKLDAATALKPYTDSRKASLLEYHLDTPAENPLFRRFAARWSYDRLEIAVVDDRAIVYELYTGSETGTAGDREVHVSIAGSLAPTLESLLESGDVEPIGELLPSGDDYAWIEADDTDPIDPDDGAIGIYGFTCQAPERYVAAADDGRPTEMGDVELATVLESAFD